MIVEPTLKRTRGHTERRQADISRHRAGSDRRARGESPRINALVDACNVASLHSQLPISLVDLDCLDPSAALAIRIAPAGTSYVFNPSSQTIDAGGLVCLYDAQGPTGTPVKDAQRTKTHDATTAALTIVWGTRALAGWTARTAQWYQRLVGEIRGTRVEPVELARAPNPRTHFLRTVLPTGSRGRSRGISPHFTARSANVDFGIPR
jgi:hypothetical protein